MKQVNTLGIDHLGLSVRNLDETARFFVEALGWTESGRDDTYPRTAVSNGACRFTLWQVSSPKTATPFDRKRNIGLHHVAIEVPRQADLHIAADRVRAYPGARLEFEPEFIGSGPRMHVIFYEPGGLRLELIWQGMA